MDQSQESGVRVVETGFRCPDMTNFNFLPFAAETEPAALINISGSNGPIKRVDNHATVNQLSGILGFGSLYPASGTIEQLSRLFWCVKSWQLSVQIQLQVPGSSASWQAGAEIFTPITNQPSTIFNDCFISLSDIKTLHLLDIFGSGTFLNEKEPLTSPANAATLPQHAIPLDPIMKWEDLLCRNKYFSWSPPQRMQSGFTQLNFANEQGSPYLMKFPMNGEPGDEIVFPNAYGLWSLSIMNSDAICRTAAYKMPTGFMPCFVPTGMDQVDFDSYSLAPQINSGALTTDSGQITGYGFYPIVSGCPPLLAYRPEYDPNDPAISGRDPKLFNPQGNKNYFPLINFMLRLKNGPLDITTVQCGFAVDVTTIQPASGWNTAGTFSILDTNITGYTSTPSTIGQRSIFQCPLYAPNANSHLIVTATLIPLDYWTTTNGLVNY